MFFPRYTHVCICVQYMYVCVYMCWNPLVRGCRCKKIFKKKVQQQRGGGGRGKREREKVVCTYHAHTVSLVIFEFHFLSSSSSLFFITVFVTCVVICGLRHAIFVCLPPQSRFQKIRFKISFWRREIWKLKKNRRPRLMRRMDIVKNNCGASDIFDFSERHSKQFCWGQKKKMTRQRRLRPSNCANVAAKKFLFPFNNNFTVEGEEDFLCVLLRPAQSGWHRFTGKRVENAVHVVSLLLFTMETDICLSAGLSSVGGNQAEPHPWWDADVDVGRQSAINEGRGSRQRDWGLGSASNPGQRLDRLLFNAQSANDQKGKWENQTKTTYFDFSLLFSFSFFSFSFVCVGEIINLHDTQVYIRR